MLTTTPNTNNVYTVLDESWVYYDGFTHEKKRVWVGPDGCVPHIVRFSTMTKRKTMLSVCFSPNGRFMVATTPYGQAINSESFVAFLRRTRQL